MQTAVVGTNGSLTYRLNLDGFPGFGWAGGLPLDAMEINKYLEKTDGSQDGAAIASFISPYSSADWAQEDAQPRIVKIKLSSMNLTGNIPSDLTKLSGLVELWLDGNSLTGPIPDFTGCVDLKIIHLEKIS
ncbi:hypothetical protein M0R45_029352 [Rubus argutus]|uniref:Uncharacterized protein n=1 Tax=Rubus argutus TaxID=59490 RepID=A0AAW1W7I5_RUBAR